MRGCIEQSPANRVEPSITASFGVCSSETTDIPTLLAAADRALYRSKNDGRNRVSVTA